MTDRFHGTDAKIAELERRLAEDPDSTLFLPLGEAYRAAGRRREAERALRAGLERHPEHGAARAALGRVLLESGRIDAAIVLLETALATSPDNLLARRLLEEARGTPPADPGAAGRAPATVGRGEFTPSPTDELSTVTLAELYLQQGDRVRALEIYREVMLREPDNPEWPERVRWLEHGGEGAAGPVPWASAAAGRARPDAAPPPPRGDRRLEALNRFLGQARRARRPGRARPDLR